MTHYIVFGHDKNNNPRTVEIFHDLYDAQCAVEYMNKEDSDDEYYWEDYD